jgi:uncharacterized OB-fold protein
VRKKLKAGIKLKAVWSDKKNGDIYDISYFKPI